MKTKIRVRGLFLNVTTRCNMHCPDCYGHLESFGPMDMSMDVAKKSTGIFFENRMTEEERGSFQSVIMFFGGEPSLNPGLVRNYIEWMDKAHPRHENDYRFSMVTNGLELAPEFLKFLLSREVEIFFSLDGPEKVHAIRRKTGESGYERILENLARAVKEGREDLLWTYTVISRKQISEIGSLLDYFKSLGIRRMAVSKDFHERFWETAEREKLLARLKAYKAANPGVSLALYPEFTGGCEDCRPMYMMVYPNGGIYDLCLTSGAVVRRSGLISQEELEAFRMGHVEDGGHLYFDLEKKRDLVRPHMNCTLLRREYDGDLPDLL